MRIRTMVLAAAVTLGLGGAATSAFAQPAWNTVHVNLPYAVTLGSKVLPAGDYTVEQMHGEDSRVLLFYGDNGMKFKTSSVTVRQLDENTPAHTSVTLYHVGDAYYLNRISVSGQDYEYEFPVPANVGAA